MKGSSSGYLVDNEGKIDFPVVGTLNLGGMTTKEAEALIKSKIVPYMSASENPIVQVRMSNYKYAMLGGIKAPGVYTAPNEKISIVEAIARAGDLDLYGQRDKIFLIRENAQGQREYCRTQEGPSAKLLLRQLHLHVALPLRHADLRLHLYPRPHPLTRLLS